MVGLQRKMEKLHPLTCVVGESSSATPLLLMFDLPPATLFLLLVVGVYTVMAAYWDTRYRRIPNFLTLPMFGAGWVYQIIMTFVDGPSHLLDGILGFLVGFGILFVLWYIGSGGAGDVKLFGALSVWLGFNLTLYVLFVSVLTVMFGTVAVVLLSIVSKGYRGTKKQYVGTGKTPAGEKPKAESVEDKQNRRFMAFAIPVAIATWAVLLWKAPTLNAKPDSAQPQHTAAVRSE